MEKRGRSQARGPPLIRLESLVRPLYRATSALALASALGLTGCGGGASSASSAPATAPPPSNVFGCSSGGSSSASSTPVPAPTFFLLAATDGVSGIELWKTDGTAGGTALVKDINTTATLHSCAGEGGTLFPSEFVFFNGAWFFSADDGVTGPELWKSDGTPGGTVQVKDINANPGAGSSPRDLTVFNNALYFSADDGVSGRELWKSDGTVGGAVQVKDIAPGAGSVAGVLAAFSSSPAGFAEVSNALYFPSDDGVTGPELWRTDGTEGNTVLVKDINPSTGSLVSELTVFGAALYFSADDGVSGPELWKTDGTNTMQVKDINTAPGAGSAPNALTVFNNALYFSANAGFTGRAL